MVQQSLRGRVIGKTARLGIITVAMLSLFLPSTIAGDGNGTTRQQMKCLLIDTNSMPNNNDTIVNGTTEEDVWEDILIALDSAVISHKELCTNNPIIIDAAAKDKIKSEIQDPGVTFTTTAIVTTAAVVGRGDEESFVKDPIRYRRRKLHEEDTINIANFTSPSLKLLNDLFLSHNVSVGTAGQDGTSLEQQQQSMYRHIAGTASCNDFMLWNVHSEPITITLEQFTNVTTLMMTTTTMKTILDDSDLEDMNCEHQFTANVVASNSPPTNGTAQQLLTRYNTFCCDGSSKTGMTSYDDDDDNDNDDGNVSEHSSSSSSSLTLTPTFVDMTVVVYAAAMIMVLFD